MNERNVIGTAAIGIDDCRSTRPIRTDQEMGMCCGIPVATGYATTRYYPPLPWYTTCERGRYCFWVVLYVRLWSIPQNGQSYAK